MTAANSALDRFMESGKFLILSADRITCRYIQVKFMGIFLPSYVFQIVGYIFFRISSRFSCLHARRCSKVSSVASQHGHFLFLGCIWSSFVWLEAMGTWLLWCKSCGWLDTVVLLYRLTPSLWNGRTYHQFLIILWCIQSCWVQCSQIWHSPGHVL